MQVRGCDSLLTLAFHRVVAGRQIPGGCQVVWCMEVDFQYPCFECVSSTEPPCVSERSLDSLETEREKSDRCATQDVLVNATYPEVVCAVAAVRKLETTCDHLRILGGCNSSPISKIPTAGWNQKLHEKYILV